MGRLSAWLPISRRNLQRIQPLPQICHPCANFLHRARRIVPGLRAATLTCASPSSASSARFRRSRNPVTACLDANHFISAERLSVPFPDKNRPQRAIAQVLKVHLSLWRHPDKLRISEQAGVHIELTSADCVVERRARLKACARLSRWRSAQDRDPEIDPARSDSSRQGAGDRQ